MEDDLLVSPDAHREFSDQRAFDATMSTSIQHKSETQQRPQSRHDMIQAREVRLRAELARIRDVNSIIVGVTANLKKAKANMDTVHSTVDNASKLLATWTRILSQTEHNQRLILNSQWRGASRDLEAIEEEEMRRRQEEDKRVAEDQRRRQIATMKAEEEERRKAAVTTAAVVASNPIAMRGHSRSKSLKGTTAAIGSTNKAYSSAGGQIGRGRGTLPGSLRGTASGIARTASVRGRGRGIG